MIRKLKSGQYRLYSRKKDPKTGKRTNLGTFNSLAAAKKHERAVQYFLENSPLPETTVRSEIRRYLVSPGQATSYKLGMLTIQRLRDEARKGLGSKFDYRAFHDVVLGGSMAPYRWLINGKSFPDASALPVSQGERVRLRLVNQTMMFHPVHLHGHTFEIAGTKLRKDTVIVRPMQRVDVDLDADNPGQWALHCHNIYHAETGMMTTVSYRA